MSASILPRALLRSVRASSSASQATLVAARNFTSSSSVHAAGPDRNIGDWDIENLEDFRFDDATSLGHLRLQQIQETAELIAKVEVDRDVLKAQARKFQPPKGQIRVTSTTDLSDPDSPYHNKRVLVAPVSALPLSSPEATHRLKLLAGPRWTPGRPGRAELGVDAAGTLGEDAKADKVGKDGWIKISEERFPSGRMNRVSLSDTLDRLVEAANDKNSPIPATTPLDPRHLLSRQRKKHSRSSQHVWARAEAMKRRSEVVGGVRGFPKEWLPAHKQ